MDLRATVQNNRRDGRGLKVEGFKGACGGGQLLEGMQARVLRMVATWASNSKTDRRDDPNADGERCRLL